MSTPAEASALARDIQRLMTGITGPGDERQIVRLLAAAPVTELNAALATLDIVQLFRDLADRLVGPDHRSAALDLLCGDRLEELALPVRARLVTAMQAGPTWRHHEHHLRRLFLGLEGEELTRFKNLINTRDSHYDLEKLLWDDIDDEGIRDEILAHIREQATPSGDVKILSDIDDTVVARLHDDRYPKGTIYPGVFALYQELDRGPGDTGDETGDLTFLTARPGDGLGIIERYTRSTMRDAGVPSFSVLTGTLFHLRSREAMAERKMVNVHRYRQLFPEYGFIFIGDSGQGDVLVGERMLEEAPETIRGVFIHDVVATPAEARAARQEMGITFFDTYAGAAMAAHAAGLIDDDGLGRVALATTEGLAAITFEDAALRAEREADLARDLATVERMLGGAR